MAKRTITIDLVPYDVTIENSTTVVHGCPLLRKLKKPERLCWTKSYGSMVGGVFVMIEYNEEGNDLYNAAIDALESIVLAHHQAGVPVTTNEYCRGLEDALVAIENHFGHVDPDKCAHHWAINEETDRTYCLYCGTDGDG